MNTKKTGVVLLVLFILAMIPNFSFAACEAASERLFLAENTDNFDEKTEHLTAALESCPDSMEILTTLIDLYIDNEFYDAAYGVAYRIISLNKYAAEGYYKLSYIYSMWEEYDKAEEAAKKAISINSYYVDSYVLLGDIQYYTRNYKDAMNGYRKALELDPNNSGAYMKIANLFFLFEKYDKVIIYIDKALKVNRNREIKLTKELIEHRINNDYKGIKAKAEEILALNPKNLMALETLSMAMLENESEKSECLDLLTKVYYLERQPFMKGKVEKEIEKLVNTVSSNTTK